MSDPRHRQGMGSAQSGHNENMTGDSSIHGMPYSLIGNLGSVIPPPHALPTYGPLPISTNQATGTGRGYTSTFPAHGSQNTPPLRQNYTFQTRPIHSHPLRSHPVWDNSPQDYNGGYPLPGSFVPQAGDVVQQGLSLQTPHPPLPTSPGLSVGSSSSPLSPEFPQTPQTPQTPSYPQAPAVLGELGFGYIGAQANRFPATPANPLRTTPANQPQTTPQAPPQYNANWGQPGYWERQQARHRYETQMAEASIQLDLPVETEAPLVPAPTYVAEAPVLGSSPTPSVPPLEAPGSPSQFFSEDTLPSSPQEMDACVPAVSMETLETPAEPVARTPRGLFKRMPSFGSLSKKGTVSPSTPSKAKASPSKTPKETPKGQRPGIISRLKSKGKGKGKSKAKGDASSVTPQAPVADMEPPGPLGVFVAQGTLGPQASTSKRKCLAAPSAAGSSQNVSSPTPTDGSETFAQYMERTAPIESPMFFFPNELEYLEKNSKSLADDTGVAGSAPWAYNTPVHVPPTGQSPVPMLADSLGPIPALPGQGASSGMPHNGKNYRRRPSHPIPRSVPGGSSAPIPVNNPSISIDPSHGYTSPSLYSQQGPLHIAASPNVWYNQPNSASANIPPTWGSEPNGSNAGANRTYPILSCPSQFPADGPSADSEQVPSSSSVPCRAPLADGGPGGAGAGGAAPLGSVQASPASPGMALHPSELLVLDPARPLSAQPPFAPLLSPLEIAMRRQRAQALRTRPVYSSPLRYCLTNSLLKKRKHISIYDLTDD